MRCIPPGIMQMPAHHANHHHPLLIYNIDPALGALVPLKPPQLPCRQPPPNGGASHDPAPATREPRAEPARLAAAPAARNASAELARMAAAFAAQEPRAELARGAVGALRPDEAWDEWVRDWDAVPGPRGGESISVVLQVYGWLNWATSPYNRNQTFHTVPLRRDRGRQKGAPGGWLGPGNTTKGSTGP